MGPIDESSHLIPQDPGFEPHMDQSSGSGVDALKSGEQTSPPSKTDVMKSFLGEHKKDIALAGGFTLELMGLSSIALGAPLCVASPIAGGVFIGIGAILMLAGAVPLMYGIKDMVFDKDDTKQETEKPDEKQQAAFEVGEQKHYGLEEGNTEIERERPRLVDEESPSHRNQQEDFSLNVQQTQVNTQRLSPGEIAIMRDVQQQAYSVTARAIASP